MRRPRPVSAAAWQNRRGIAALEFALIAPVLLLLLFTVYDVTNAMTRTSKLQMAARVAGQYALAMPMDSAGIASTALAQLPGWTNVTVASTAMSCRCDNGAAANCTTGTCVVGAVTHAPIGTISVTLTERYSFASPISAALFPGLVTLRGNVELRVH
jgi:Flp pilus assembly protein TadG